MEVVICIGHLSKFGVEVFQQLLSATYFRVQTIVIASADRWITFQKKIKPQETFDENRYKKYHAKQTAKLRSFLKTNNWEIEIKTVDSIGELSQWNFPKKEPFLFCAAFPQIFPAAVISHLEGRVVNFHPSYLPRCRGANPVYWTIASGEKYGGISSHFMLPEIDKGPIIARRKIAFPHPTIDYDTLYHLVLAEIPALVKEMEQFFKTDQSPTPQEENEATYFRQNTLIHERIYWEKESMATINAKIRAGGAFCFLSSGEKIKLIPPVYGLQKLKTVTNTFEERLSPGMVVQMEKEQIYVRCKDGYIQSNQIVETSWRLLLQRIPLLRKYAAAIPELNQKIAIGAMLH